MSPGNYLIINLPKLILLFARIETIFFSNWSAPNYKYSTPGIAKYAI